MKCKRGEIMINRKEYLNQLIDLKDTDVIKVITGIRRCGKSTLFQLYIDYLRNQGIENKQIIHINFESLEFENLLDYKQLYHYILDNIDSDKTNYVFLDEIQNVNEFQKVIDSLHLKKNIDLYITGSNAYLLSGELATLLSGRYIEIKMQPLSFKEYVEGKIDNLSIEKKYVNYLIDSSFPGALEFKTRNKINEYISGLYNTIILKDVVARLKIADVFMLESIIKFLFDNIGNITSTKKIADTMMSSGRTISVHTVEKYIKGLEDSFIIYRVGRFDTKGKQFLKTGDKYYVADIGIRFYLLGNRGTDYGHILENIVYLELLRRGYNISIGKVGNLEVDFIARNTNITEYYQVALTVRDDKTLLRELKSLESITDHNPKYLLTLDSDPETDYNGIKKLNALDWLIK